MSKKQKYTILAMGLGCVVGALVLQPHTINFVDAPVFEVMVFLYGILVFAANLPPSPSVQRLREEQNY